MMNRWTKLIRLHAPALWRGLWLLMLLGHGPALWRRFGLFMDSPTTEAVAFVVLLLANAFFVAKIVDVAWLRVRTDRRSAATLIIAVALIHWNVLPGPSGAAVQNHGVAVLTELLLISTLICSRRLVHGFCNWVHTIRGETLRPRFRQWCCALDVVPRLRQIPLTPLIPRSPPARCVS